MQKSNRIMQACVALALAGRIRIRRSHRVSQLMEQNASGLGNAYAGQAAAAENASTIYFNPAGMTLLPGTQASGHRSPRSSRRTSFDAQHSSCRPLPLGGTFRQRWRRRRVVEIHSDGLPVVSVQSHRCGWGSASPRRSASKPTTTPIFGGRFQSQKIKLTTYDINPSVAWKVNDWLSVGGGLSYQHAKVELNSSVNIGIEALQNLQVERQSVGLQSGRDVQPVAEYPPRIDLPLGR